MRPQLDDGVTIRTEAHAHKNFLDVAQAGHVAVDEVFALAGTIQPAANHHFAGHASTIAGFLGALFPGFDRWPSSLRLR